MPKQNGKKTKGTGIRNNAHRPYEKGIRLCRRLNGIDCLIGTEVNLIDAEKRIDAVLIETTQHLTLLEHDIFGRITVNEFKSASSTIDSTALVQATGYQSIVEDVMYKTDPSSPADIKVVISGFSIHPSLIGKDVEGFRTFHGVKVENKRDGVYNVTGYGFAPTSIILLNELPGDEFACLRILGKNAKPDDVRTFYRQIKALEPFDTETRDCIHAVACEFFINNYESFENYDEEDRQMINDFQRYTHTYIEDIQRTSEMNGLIRGRKEGREEGRREQTNELLAALDKENRSGKTSFSLDDLYRMLRKTGDEGN